MTAGKSAGELIKTASEINRLHRLVTEAAQTSLQYSIEIGTMLIDVKKDVKHGDWEAWLAKYCPDISDRTARMYMRLAKPENAEKLEAAAEQNGNAVADLSVRSAAKLLSKPRPPKPPGGDAPKKTSGKRKPASPDLKDLLMNVGPDELIKALDQAAWNGEQIRELVDNLASRFRAPQAKPIPDDLSIPTNLQRTLPPQAEPAKELRRSL
jgi:Protein of unknown function (DUF3102)